eukprot:979904-Prorocentrum_minimum.AAC.4
MPPTPPVGGNFACRGTRHHGGDNAACARHIAERVSLPCYLQRDETTIPILITEVPCSTVARQKRHVAER